MKHCYIAFLFTLVACGPTRSPASAPGPESSAQGVLGVDHVGLTVSKLEASKQFFVSELGFRVRKHDPEYPAYFLTNGHTVLTLWRASDPAKATAFNRKNNIGLHHLAFSVSSFAALNELHARLRKRADVRIEFAPERAYGGPAKHMIFREPSGNRIELVHRPK